MSFKNNQLVWSTCWFVYTHFACISCSSERFSFGNVESFTNIFLVRNEPRRNIIIWTLTHHWSFAFGLWNIYSFLTSMTLQYLWSPIGNLGGQVILIHPDKKYKFLSTLLELNSSEAIAFVWNLFLLIKHAIKPRDCLSHRLGSSRIWSRMRKLNRSILPCDFKQGDCQCFISLIEFSTEILRQISEQKIRAHFACMSTLQHNLFACYEKDSLNSFKSRHNETKLSIGMISTIWG